MQDSRTKILNAASEIFLAGGMPALSVRAIAKRAGLSTIGIYSHFDGKQGILDALYIEGFERVAQAMTVATQDVDPLQRVLAAAAAYLDVADQFGAHYRLIFGETDQSYSPSAEALAVANTAFQLLVSGVGGLLADNAKYQEKQKYALEIWAIVHGYVGLKNHEVAAAVPDADWNQLALTAVKRHIDADARQQ